MCHVCVGHRGGGGEEESGCIVSCCWLKCRQLGGSFVLRKRVVYVLV